MKRANDTLYWKVHVNGTCQSSKQSDLIHVPQIDVQLKFVIVKHELAFNSVYAAYLPFY